MKIYDVVKDLLVQHPKLRDSDRLLIWNVWNLTGHLSTDGRSISLEDFKVAPHMESIRRVRQKIQEQHPELRSTHPVQEVKDSKEAWGGNHVYREEIWKI